MVRLLRETLQQIGLFHEPRLIPTGNPKSEGAERA